jgi:hypothetical protein
LIVVMLVGLWLVVLGTRRRSDEPVLVAPRSDSD